MRASASALYLQVSKYWESICLATILVAALCVRLYGIRFGLPNLYHPDEWAIVDRALAMLRTGDYNPRNFGYPSLYMYIQAIVFVFRFFYGVSKGQFDSLENIQLHGFYAWGRMVTAFFGVATVYVVYLIGKKMYGPKAGLLAAAVLSFSFLHSRDSHYITVDVPSTFWVALSFLFAYMVIEKQEAKYYALAGLFAGLATATKWNAAPVLIPLLVAHLFGSCGKGLIRGEIFLGILAFAAGIFIGTPYAILDLPAFLRTLADVIIHYRSGHVGYEARVPWLFYINHMFSVEGMGPTLFISVVSGFFWGLAKDTKKSFLLILFPSIYFLFVSRSAVTFARNMLPVYPLLAVSGGYFLYKFTSSIKETIKNMNEPIRYLVSGTLIVLVLAHPAFKVLQFGYASSLKDTRTKAAEWIEENLESGSKIGAEFYAPPISSNFEVVKFNLLDHSMKWYQEEGFDYLVFDGADYDRFFEDPEKYSREVKLYRSLFKEGILIKEFPGDPRVEKFLSPTIKIYRVPSSSNKL